MERSIRVSHSEHRINSNERPCATPSHSVYAPKPISQLEHLVGHTPTSPILDDDQSPVFRQIVESSPVLLHTARPDGYLNFFNQTWLDFAGVPLKELLGWGWTSYIHPEDVEALVQKMRESFAK